MVFCSLPRCWGVAKGWETWGGKGLDSGETLDKHVPWWMTCSMWGVQCWDQSINCRWPQGEGWRPLALGKVKSQVAGWDQIRVQVSALAFLNCLLVEALYSLQSYGLWLLCSWSSPGKKTGVGFFSFFRGSSQTRDWITISCIGRRVLYHQTTGEALVEGGRG